MKHLIIIAIFSSLFSVQSFAKSITCANLDYSAKAEVSELYAGVILLRRLHKVELKSETIFKSYLGKVDKSESFEKNGYKFDLFSGGLTVKDGQNLYELACGAPFDYAPDSLEHQDHIENWNYLFQP